MTEHPPSNARTLAHVARTKQRGKDVAAAARVRRCV
jgi:hypothetical protein